VANVGTVYHTAGVGMVAASAPQPTHYLVAASAPVYYTYQASTPSASLSPLANTSAALFPSPTTNVAPAMMKSAGASASIGGATSDYVSEYNAFLQQEVARSPGAAGVRTNPSDIAVFQQNHAQLTAGVGGAERLGSIGRFLLQKLGDPNFRNNAIKLFEPLLGTFLPQYAPLIDLFLNDLTKGSGGGGGGLSPLNQNGGSLNIPANGAAFDASGVVNGRLILTPAGGTPSPVNPPPPGPPQRLTPAGGTPAPSPL
jgi:hypothetical protein